MKSTYRLQQQQTTILQHLRGALSQRASQVDPCVPLSFAAGGLLRGLMSILLVVVMAGLPLKANGKIVLATNYVAVTDPPIWEQEFLAPRPAPPKWLAYDTSTSLISVSWDAVSDATSY